MYKAILFDRLFQARTIRKQGTSEFMAKKTVRITNSRLGFFRILLAWDKQEGKEEHTRSILTIMPQVLKFTRFHIPKTYYDTGCLD